MTTGNALSNWIAPWSTRVNTWCPPFSVLNLAQNSNSVGPHLSKVLNCGPIPSSFSSCPWASKVFTQEATLMYGYFLSFPTFPELMSTSKRRPCWASVRATSSSLGYLRMAPSWFNFYKQGTGHNLMYTINDRLISIQFSKHIQPPIIQPEKTIRVYVKQSFKSIPGNGMFFISTVQCPQHRANSWSGTGVDACVTLVIVDDRVSIVDDIQSSSLKV